VIECIFTVDYEIYGNGRGPLKELIYDPAEKLRTIFKKWSSPWVAFVEAAELEITGDEHRDSDSGLVERQVRDLYRDGVEIGLHLHPQWYNARYEESEWQLDYSEYNLCHLSLARIDQIIERSISYLRRILDVPNFTPLSFRAGNWLLQPAGKAAQSLAAHGIRIDSSVFKGGLQYQQGLDYRGALKNGYYWTFTEDVNVPDRRGSLLELPIFTKMVPPWEMFTAKRIALQQKGSATAKRRVSRLARLRDFARFRHPMKLDICRLSTAQMIRMFDRELGKDQRDPGLFRPIVAIGHTKDLIEVESIDAFLSYLRAKGIPISTFKDVYAKIPGRHEP
jgi:hypothetical protein